MKVVASPNLILNQQKQNCTSHGDCNCENRRMFSCLGSRVSCVELPRNSSLFLPRLHSEVKSVCLDRSSDLAPAHIVEKLDKLLALPGLPHGELSLETHLAGRN
jgi:hypothetical protein